MLINKVYKIIFSVTILLASTDTVWACSMCYKDPTSPMTIGLKSAVLVLLGALFIVFAAFIKFIYSFRKRSQILAQHE